MKISYKPLFVAVFLVIAGLATKSSLTEGAKGAEVKALLATKSAGQPSVSAALIGVAQAESEGLNTALTQSGAITINVPSAPENIAFDSYMPAMAQDSGQPIGSNTGGTETITYKVKRGDTLSAVALRFGVSPDSIVSVNRNIRKKTLQVGQTIAIPGIAVASTSTSDIASLPNFDSSFISPAQGYPDGSVGADNSINIENSCGTPVVAAADGIVVPDHNIGAGATGWNDGYGTFVLVEHPFGSEVYTRYSHLQDSLVSIGNYVKQGQKIGLMGDSGNANGCELNFQVIGAHNPLAK